MREDLQTRFRVLNPDWDVQAGAVAPDGDVFLEDEQVLHFRVPSCQDCGGILKPEVTFFGDSVNKATVHFVHDRLAESDAVLVVGSSLQVSLCANLFGTDNMIVILHLTVSPLLFQRSIQDTGFYWQPATGKFRSPS